MTDKRLKAQIKNQVEGEHLDENQLARLQAMVQQRDRAQAAQSGAGGPSRRSFLAGMATAAGLAGMGLGAWQVLQSSSVTPEALSAEVLRNHQERKSLDIATDRFEQMAAVLSDGLNFKLTRSRVFPGDKLSLQGGRYCSLNGVKAVQILFRRPDESLVTLYQTRHRPDRFQAIPSSDQFAEPLGIERNNHRIRLWVESGLLMATAEPL